MEQAELIERLRTVLIDFTSRAEKLLQQDAHEDSIVVELHGCLKEHFHDWPYDINHNYDKRVLNNELVKKQTLFVLANLPKSKVPKNANLNDEYVLKELLPDIIFHDLDGPEHNFLIFEIKKTTNKGADDRKMDLLKLSTATAADLKYDYGIFLSFKTGEEFDNAAPVYFELYHNGEVIYQEEIQIFD